jgi:hypothetical protein
MNGNSVYAFEKDKAQVHELKARIQAALTLHNTLASTCNQDNTPQSLLQGPEAWEWVTPKLVHFNRSIPSVGVSDAYAEENKVFKAMKRAAKKVVVEDSKDDEVMEEVVPGCYRCGKLVNEGDAVFCCSRCGARSHFDCQDGDGEVCLSCAGIIEEELIMRLRAEAALKANKEGSAGEEVAPTQ